MKRAVLHLAVAVTLLAAGAQPAHAQAAGEEEMDTTRVFLLDGLNVTATRGTRSVFETPAPVTVVEGARLREEAASSVADLFLELPGLDGDGVGPAQRRPVIRGFRGQRVLLLEDGLRLNNPRRRVDSGEPTGLVWMSALERVEVVRGPASVLYGSDAIGGVVNLVTRPAPLSASGVRGFVEASHRSAGEASRLSGEVATTVGRVGLRISGGYRDAGAYEAPSGSFGSLRLDDDVTVHDSGVTDGTLRLEARLQAAEGQDLFLRHEAYRSEDSGFGWIDPAVFGPEAPKTRLFWPEHRFGRTVAGYRGAELDWRVADAVDATLYHQTNDRTFITEVRAPIPGTPGVVDVLSENFTELSSSGLRLEARKLVGAGVLLTYGLDANVDRSEGTDTSTTTLSGLGPPSVSGRGGPQVPDARMRNVGLFAQAQVEAGSSTEVVLGTRYQDVRSEALATPGNDAEPVTYRDRTVVGTASVLQGLGPRVKLVASVGRGFRTPNLVERFFTGLTGNNRGYWEANPELSPESSLNLELGARLRAEWIQAEAFVFQNTLTDGIVLEPTGEKVGRATVYRNVNVDELRYRGVEAAAAAALGAGLTLRGNATVLDIEDARNPERVLAETYPSKARAGLRWDDPADRFWVAWDLRRNGQRSTLEGTTPVGDTIPAFTVQDVSAGVSFLDGHRLTVAVENLADALYAEALNTGFFRPEPGRTFVVSWGVRF